jgi:hypothetical protein
MDVHHGFLPGTDWLALGWHGDSGIAGGDDPERLAVLNDAERVEPGGELWEIPEPSSPWSRGVNRPDGAVAAEHADGGCRIARPNNEVEPAAEAKRHGRRGRDDG